MENIGRGRLKLGTVVLLTVFSFIIYILIYYVWEKDVPFRFVYFLPAVLACLWWGRKGIPLALLLAVLLPVLLLLSPVDARIWDDIVGSIVILITIMIIAELSERRSRLIETLEEKVGLRTAELSERNRELESYGHTISHDLLGPVTLIKGYATIARERLPQDAGEMEKESLGKIIEAADRMTRLTTSLLEYARAGSAEGKVEPVDSGEVLRSVLQELDQKIREAGGEAAAAPDPPAILVDPLRLRQAFSNILGNAVKFKDEHRLLRIEIDFFAESDIITFVIRDNGEGMEAREVGEIFEPFKRFSHDESPGAGIGLATVKRAVEGWGGRIWVESVPGKGTTFYFTARAAP